MAHVLVTGGAGFIGSRMAVRLLADGHRVTVVDDLSTGVRANVPEGAEFIEADLGTEAGIAKLSGLTDVDAVFHLAGQSSGEASFADPLDDLESHVVSTLLLGEWCRERGVSRLLYASSMATYGDPAEQPVVETQPQNPKTPYAAAKTGAEAYCRLLQTLGVDTTVFRLFSVYGPGQNLENMQQGMVSIFLAYMLAGETVVVKGPLDRYRDFVFVEDVVDAWIRCWGDPGTFGKTYNVASGRKTTVADLLDALKAAFGRPDYPAEGGERTPGDQFGVVGSSELLNADTGWTAQTALVDGIRKMVDYEKGKRA